MATIRKNGIRAGLLFLAVCGLFMGACAARAASWPIYNEHANARRDIAAAISRAGRTGKNVVLIFGANW